MILFIKLSHLAPEVVNKCSQYNDVWHFIKFCYLGIAGKRGFSLLPKIHVDLTCFDRQSAGQAVQCTSLPTVANRLIAQNSHSVTRKVYRIAESVRKSGNVLAARNLTSNTDKLARICTLLCLSYTVINYLITLPLNDIFFQTVLLLVFQFVCLSA